MEVFSDLKNKKALITGGAGDGYGRQIVDSLAEAGATVIISSRSLDAAEKRAEEIKARGFKAIPACLSLSSGKGIEEGIDTIHQEVGPLDILVNNAVAHNMNSFENISINEWNEILSVNITGTMLITRKVGSKMLKNGGGSIINLGSIYGVVSPDHGIYGDSGENNPLIYGICKASIIQMTKYLATYWSPTIRVNCISPGGLFNGQDKYFVENYCNRTPLKRMGNKNDLKGLVLLLASDASSWITGQNIMVDGGWTIW